MLNKRRIFSKKLRFNVKSSERTPTRTEIWKTSKNNGHSYNPSEFKMCAGVRGAWYIYLGTVVGALTSKEAPLCEAGVALGALKAADVKELVLHA